MSDPAPGQRLLQLVERLRQLESFAPDAVEATLGVRPLARQSTNPSMQTFFARLETSDLEIWRPGETTPEVGERLCLRPHAGDLTADDIVTVWGTPAASFPAPSSADEILGGRTSTKPVVRHHYLDRHQRLLLQYDPTTRSLVQIVIDRSPR